MTAPADLTVRPGVRCSCHHAGRRCNYQCENTAALVRGSDSRPVCLHCEDHDPSTSAGFSFPPDAIQQVDQ
jgi:hypothetical protein